MLVNCGPKGTELVELFTLVHELGHEHLRETRPDLGEQLSERDKSRLGEIVADTYSLTRLVSSDKISPDDPLIEDVVRLRRLGGLRNPNVFHNNSSFVEELVNADFFSIIKDATESQGRLFNHDEALRIVLDVYKNFPLFNQIELYK